MGEARDLLWPGDESARGMRPCAEVFWLYPIPRAKGYDRE